MKPIYFMYGFKTLFNNFFFETNLECYTNLTPKQPMILLNKKPDNIYLVQFQIHEDQKIPQFEWDRNKPYKLDYWGFFDKENNIITYADCSFESFYKFGLQQNKPKGELVHLQLLSAKKIIPKHQYIIKNLKRG